MEKELISIILPVYNGSRFLRESIESCLGQTYSNIELIIIDDCSEDNSLRIAEEYALNDNRVQVFKNEENLKLPSCLNSGHRHSKGNFITWTSDDNVYHKNALDIMYNTLNSLKVDVVYSDYLIIDQQGNLKDKRILPSIESLLFSGVIGACFLYKKEVYQRNKYYEENLFLVEDFDFWLRALKHSSYFKIENPGLYFYRIHEESLTSNINLNADLRDVFLENKKKSLENFLQGIAMKNKNTLIDYVILRFLEKGQKNLIPFKTKGFIKDLEIICESNVNFSKRRMVKLIMEDSIGLILMDKKFQNFSALLALHREAGNYLLGLPIKRYLAVVKKCLF